MVRALATGGRVAEKALRGCRHVRHPLFLLWAWHAGDQRGSAAALRAMGTLLRKVLDGQLEADVQEWRAIVNILHAARAYAGCAARALRTAGEDGRQDMVVELLCSVNMWQAELACTPGRPLDKEAWRLALRMLAEFEEDLSAHWAYWTMLGLGYLLDGQSDGLVMETLAKGLPAGRSSVEARKAAPLAWDGWLIGKYGSRWHALRQICSLPDAFFDVWRKWLLPSGHEVPAWEPADMWEGLCPDGRSLAEGWRRMLKGARTREVAASVLGSEKVLETEPVLSTDLGVRSGEAVGAVGLTTLHWRVADIVPLLTWCRCGWAQRLRYGALIPFVQMRPVPKNRNFKGRLLRFHVHPDGALAEVDAQVDGWAEVRALVPFYAKDQEDIKARETEWGGYLCAIGRRMRMAREGDERPPEPAVPGTPVYRLRGRVRSLGPAKVYGGARALKVTLEQGDLASGLPVYLCPERVEGGTVEPGRFVDCEAVLALDVF